MVFIADATSLVWRCNKRSSLRSLSGMLKNTLKRAAHPRSAHRLIASPSLHHHHIPRTAQHKPLRPVATMLSSSIFVYALALVASVTPQLAHAVPLTDGLAPRGPQSFSLPDLTKYLNPSAGNKAGSGAASSCPSTGGGDLTQKTLCSTGTSYCCVSEARGMLSSGGQTFVVVR